MWLLLTSCAYGRRWQRLVLVSAAAANMPCRAWFGSCVVALNITSPLSAGHKHWVMYPAASGGSSLA